VRREQKAAPKTARFGALFTQMYSFPVVDYPCGAEFENLGTNVEVVVNGTLVDGNSNTTFKLAQFHFHTPAEHRVNSEFYPMEMHWVFESDGK